MANIVFNVSVTMEGPHTAEPSNPGYIGSFLLLATTGTTQSAALTALSGATSSTLCHSVPISEEETISITASTSPIYVACAAVRPGSSFYFDTGQCIRVYAGSPSTFTIHCPIPWGEIPYMTEKYATGITAATSTYFFKNYQDLSGATYQNEKLAKASYITSYFKFPIVGTANGRYATIKDAYYNETNTAVWQRGQIAVWYGSQGYTVTFAASDIYLYIDNSTPYGIGVIVEVRAYEVDSDYMYYGILYTNSPVYVSSYGAAGGYYFTQFLPPEGEIGSINITVDTTDGRGLPFSATIKTAGMGMLNFNGTTDGGYVQQVDLSNDIEIQRVDILISTT